MGLMCASHTFSYKHKWVSYYVIFIGTKSGSSVEEYFLSRYQICSILFILIKHLTNFHASGKIHITARIIWKEWAINHSRGLDPSSLQSKMNFHLTFHTLFRSPLPWCQSDSEHLNRYRNWLVAVCSDLTKEKAKGNKVSFRLQS